MKQIKIDLANYGDISTEAPIRQTFFKDATLRLIYVLVYLYQPISITEITREVNRLKHTNLHRGLIRQRIEKIINFGIIESKITSDCKENGSVIDLAILKKQKETPNGIGGCFGSKRYYYLTETGIEWIAKVDEIQSRFKNGGL